jgi:hypothetical protein
MSTGDVQAESVEPVIRATKKQMVLKKKKAQSSWIDHRRLLKSQGYDYSKYPLNDLVAGAYVYAGRRVVLYKSGYYCFRKVVYRID